MFFSLQLSKFVCLTLWSNVTLGFA